MIFTPNAIDRSASAQAVDTPSLIVRSKPVFWCSISTYGQAYPFIVSSSSPGISSILQFNNETLDTIYHDVQRLGLGNGQ